MHCGQALAASPPPNPGPGFPDPTRQNKAALWGTVAAVALAGIIFAGLTATGVLRFGRTDTDTALKAHGAEDVPVLQARGSDTGPTMAEPDRARVTMPDDVRAWLEHLRETEEKRTNLAKDQIMKLVVVKAGLGAGGVGAVMKGLLGEANGEDPSPPTKQVEQATEDLRAPWQDILKFFRSVDPPAECVPIRDKYDQPLRETQAVIADINSILDGAQSGGDPTELIAKLNVIFDSHKKTIDIPAAETDAMVGQICEKYQTRKWFSIQGNVGGGSVMTAGGGF